MKRIIFKMTLNEINSILSKLKDEQFKTLTVDFDFENEKIIINDKKTLKVESDSEFTYKFMKTKVKASGGIEQLYKHIKEASEPGSFWNNRIYCVLSKAAS